MKNKFKEILKKIVYALKTMIFLVVMIMGFWVIYGMIWLKVGLPTPDWYIWILVVLSLVSTRLFLGWL
jgi:hypothetical protein